MYKNTKIILVAFASDDLKLSADRFRQQAINSKYYDDIKIFNPNNFNRQMIEIFEDLKKKRKKRGYGYWFWKPIFIQRVMGEIEIGDIIHYADIGCHIQNKNNRYFEYLDIIIDKNTWLLPFQYHLENVAKTNQILFQKREEFKYSKADLLDYFKCINDKKITDTPQFWSGTFFIKKNVKSISFLNNWIEVYKERFDLIDDSESIIANRDGFVENRHDQSIFSILCKKNDIQSLSAYECEWGEKNGKRTWDHNLENPILAKRDLKFNIFKRFLNRQIKTIKRYKKKILN